MIDGVDKFASTLGNQKNLGGQKVEKATNN